MSSEAHGHDEHGVHVSPTSTYALILAALIVLTVVTAWVAFYDFGWANDIVALGIAFTKASLVVLFFMHVKYSGRIIKLVVVSALAWLFLMFGLTYLDYASREGVVADPQRVRSDYQDLIDRGYTASVSGEVGHEGEAGHGEDADH